MSRALRKSARSKLHEIIRQRKIQEAEETEVNGKKSEGREKKREGLADISH